MKIELGQLVSWEGPKRGEMTMLGTRMVWASFLKDILHTSAFNALHQPYQLQQCANDTWIVTPQLTTPFYHFQQSPNGTSILGNAGPLAYKWRAGMPWKGI